MKVRPEVTSLRTKARVQVIRRALAEVCCGDGFRIVDWSIQSNHLHAVVEADSNRSLARGMQRFCIRVAKGLNRLAQRKGQVFTQRYHLHVLTTPAEVRHARAYVLNNHRRHAVQYQRHIGPVSVDPFSSWAWFNGWQGLHGAYPRKRSSYAVDRHSRQTLWGGSSQ